MNYHEKIIEAIELHDVGGIIDCFKNGVDANRLFKGEPLIYELISEYTRSPRFALCVHAFVSNGLRFNDPALLAVLLNDASALERHLQKEPTDIDKKYTLRCAYTQMKEVSLLHICAEFNHVACAQILVNRGLPVDTKAGIDRYGFGGQTPIFHTVNQNGNQSFDMLKFLLAEKADLHFTVKGLIWGQDYSWETLIPSCNPISYAMMGNLPQMHRREAVIAEIVKILLEEAYGIDYPLRNIPNAYLAH